jgi:hypothetical protein
MSLRKIGNARSEKFQKEETLPGVKKLDHRRRTLLSLRTR